MRTPFHLAARSALSTLTALFAALTTLTTFAHAASLTGSVRDLATGKPVPQAIVRLTGRGLSDTTDAQGRFAFSFTSALRSAGAHSAPHPRFLPGRGLAFALPERGPVRIEVADLAGKSVAVLGGAVLEAGAWVLPLGALPAGRYQGRIMTSAGASSFRFLSLARGQVGSAPVLLEGPEGAALAKAEAGETDTLITVKAGYRSDTLAWAENAADSVTVYLRDTSSGDAGPAVRAAMALDRDWLFNKGDAPGAENPAFTDAGWRTVDVPHDWSIEGPFDENAPTSGYGGYLPAGVGWYRKKFTLPQAWSGRRIFVEFDGVMANGTVWINGTSLGTRPSGYATFRYEITPQAAFGAGGNVLAVKADNSRQPASRWYSGAGIYRHVRLIAMDPVHFGAFATFATTPTLDNVHVTTTVENQGSAAGVVAVEAALIDPDGKRLPAVVSAEQSVAAGGTADFSLDIPVAAAQPWSPDSPKLYTLVTTLRSGGRAVDDESIPIGIRTMKYDHQAGFVLNGKSVKQKGVCLHHDMSGLGAAVPLRAMQRRLAILKSLGVNAIRSAHNQMDPRVLDLCDRMGIMVMEEFFDVWIGHKYGMPGDYATWFNQTGPGGRKWYQYDLAEGVKRDRNHVSVVFYSIGNEIRDAVSARIPLAKDMAAICHALDPTRPVTQALFRPKDANDYPGATLDVLDVFGVNYRNGELIEAVGGGSRYVGVSTEQGPDVAEWASLYLKHPEIVGEYLWAGADYLGESPNAWPQVGATSGLIDRVGDIKSMGYSYQGIWASKSTPRPKTASGSAVKIILTVDHPAIAADVDDVAYVKASLVDASGAVATGANAAVTFRIAGSGGAIRAFDSGSSQAESFAGPSRKAYNGVCYAVVQMKAAGQATVTASAPGLGEASVTITGTDVPFVPCAGSCD